MGAEGNGLTLESLAQRLEALQREHAEKLQTLERENERMRSENAELRHKVATLEGSGTRHHVEEEPASEPSEVEGRVSRRWLLSRAGAAAAGLVVAGALTQRDIREAKASSPVRHSINIASRGAFEGTNIADAGYGVWGNASNIGVRGTGASIGVFGSGHTGVNGTTTSAGGAGVSANGGAGSYAVLAISGQRCIYATTSRSNGYGVWGENRKGTGVHGKGQIAGVSGESTSGIGVKGTGAAGVKGDSNTAGRGAVEGSMENDAGYGVWGNSWGIGVRGTGSTDGVHGIGTNGYGGQFDGSKAQLRLVPGSSLGSPTTGAHIKGELYMDSGATLWVCVADGSPGAWEQISIVG